MGQPAAPQAITPDQIRSKIQQYMATGDTQSAQRLGQLLHKMERGGGQSQAPQQEPQRPPQGQAQQGGEPPKQENQEPSGPQAPPQQQADWDPNDPNIIQMEPQEIVGQAPDVVTPVFDAIPEGSDKSFAMRAMEMGYFPEQSSMEYTEELSLEERQARLQQDAAAEARRGIDFDKYPDSETHMAALYAPSIAQPKEETDLPTWVHIEPTVDHYKEMVRAHAEWEPTGQEPDELLGRLEEAKRWAPLELKELEESGDSEAFRQYRDAVWQRVYRDATEVGQKAIRAAHVPEREGLEDDLARFQGSKAGATAYNFMDAANVGFGMPFLAWFNSDMEETPLAQRLRERGLYGGELSEYQKVKEQHGWAPELIGTAAGYMMPGTLPSRIYGGIGKAAAKGAGTAASRGALGRIGAGAMMGGLTDAGFATSRSILADVLSRRPVDARRAAEAGVTEGVAGALGDAAFGVVGEVGSRAAQKARAANPELHALEHGTNYRARSAGDTGERLFASDASQDNILGNAVRRAGGVVDPGAPGGTMPTSSAASDYAAREIWPSLRGKAKEAVETIESNKVRFFSTPQARQEKPVTETFKALRRLVDKSLGASDSVRKSAGKALANVSEFKLFTSGEAARAQGGIAVRMDDALLSEMGWETKANQARKRWMQSRRADIGQAVTPPAPHNSWVVLEPKRMDAEALDNSLDDLYHKISFGGASEDAPTGVKAAAEAMRRDRKQWPGFDEMTARNYELISSLEGTGQILGGMSFREMAGGGTPERFLDTIDDMPLKKVSKFIRHVYQPGNERSSEQFAKLLDNKRLTKLLKGVRAAMAWEALNNKGANAHAVVDPVSGNTRTVVNLSNLNRYLYGAGRGLERMYRSGNMPKAARVLLEPESYEFVKSVGDGTLNELMSAYDSLTAREQRESR